MDKRDLTYLIVLFLSLTFVVGCGNSPWSSSIERDPASAEIATLVQNLEQQADSHVIVKGYVSQFFLSVPGRLLMVNGGRVGIYVYQDSQTASMEADRIYPDGNTVSISPEGEPIRTELHYYGFPHFFLKDNMIGFYLGESEAVLRPLELTMGTQIAGRLRTTTPK
ncbi:MAG: hypothetical protein VX701_05025 [Chloroflexota bacterium]|nr:hypothetical protein [Chloroflexota bacterium]